jgi:hypothetical protein
MTTVVDTDKLASLRALAGEKYDTIEVDYRGTVYIKDVKAIDEMNLLVSLYPELPASRLRAIERLKSTAYRSGAGYRHKLSRSSLRSLVSILGGFPTIEELSDEQREIYKTNQKLIQLIINDAVASLVAADSKYEEWCNEEGRGNVQIVDKL